MQPKPTISIIVPVYNTGKYLHRCIDSIIAQTFTDWECILIDDGSTDESPDICDEYAKRDSRIKVFHTENSGVASARQFGTDNAKGIYSIHVDSDDWIESNMLEDMYSVAVRNNVDIVIADFFVHTIASVSKVSCGRYGLVPSIEICRLIASGRLMGSLWNKLIRHDVYKDWGVQYVKGVNYCEDVLVICQLLQHQLKVFFINKAFYHYNKTNENSISTNYTQRTFQTRKSFLASLKQILDTKSYKSEIQDAEFCVKMEALYYGVITAKDFANVLPSSFYTIMRSNCSWKRKVRYVIYSFVPLGYILFRT